MESVSARNGESADIKGASVKMNPESHKRFSDLVTGEAIRGKIGPSMNAIADWLVKQELSIQRVVLGLDKERLIIAPPKHDEHTGNYSASQDEALPGEDDQVKTGDRKTGTG